MSLDRNLQERIREANVAVHRCEAKFYELMHPEIYSSCEQERLNTTLRMVDCFVADDGVRAKRALDFGAGTGNLTCKLLQLGYKVTAVDVSAEMCGILKKKCRQYLDDEKLVVVNSPIEDVGFGSGEFDLITCYSVLHHLPDYVDVIQRFCGLLKKGGVMYLEHEASPFYWKNEASNASNLVKLVYLHSNMLLNFLYFRLLRVNLPSIDYSLSDYWHNEKHHLDHEQIRHIFETEHFESFKRTDYHLKSRTWVSNPLFSIYKHVCKPEMSFWVAKK